MGDEAFAIGMAINGEAISYRKMSPINAETEKVSGERSNALEGSRAPDWSTVVLKANYHGSREARCKDRSAAPSLSTPSQLSSDRIVSDMKLFLVFVSGEDAEKGEQKGFGRLRNDSS